MNYILLIKNKEANKEFRFINSLTEHDIENLFIPQNCRLIEEGEIQNDDIFKIPIAHDSILPLTFDPEEAFVEFNPDKRMANLILATILLVTGYCQSSYKTNPGKVCSLQERLELLYNFSEKHKEFLEEFFKKEKERKSPFVYSENLSLCLEKLNESKKELLNVIKDIETLLGGKTNLLLLDFKN